jgi:hypothetical protein
MKDINDWSDYFETVRDSLTGTKAFTSFRYQTTVFESPKRFVGKMAFNIHGDWYRFDTLYRTKTGHARRIHCRNKEQLARLLMLFVRFQTLIGVTEKDELMFHTIYFLGHIPVFGGCFPPSKENIRVLDIIIGRVLSTTPPEEVVGHLKDPRKVCIEDDGRMDAAMKNSLKRRATKIYNRLVILMGYDDSESVAGNARRLGYTRPTIYDFLETRGQAEEILKKLDEE